MKQICIGVAFFMTLVLVGRVAAQNVDEGRKLYATYCATCHGDNGKGDGPAGKALPVKPADHTDAKLMSGFSDKFLFEIISKGGAALGKSSFMPSWDGVLKDNQVRDLVAYVRSIGDPKKAPGK